MSKKDYKLKVKTEKKSLTKTYGNFVIQPLERGYGVTLGNALRRVLLTSLPGAAITNVKVENVLHEFSTIPGVKDDMSDIIQNLKGVRFKLSDSDVDNVNISLKGKSVFTAGDIQKATDQFKVLNKKHYITELNSKGNLKIELRIGVGKGYVPAEENELPNAPIGTLAIDSIFNPVKKVSYNVQPVPGAKDPIEILSIELETDGSVTPEDAISFSATVMMDHLRLVESIAKPEVLEVTEKISEEIIKVRNLLNLTIDEMELSVRSHNCLQAAGIKYIYELVSKEESEMLKYKNFGRKSLTELVEKLDEMGINFGMDVDKYLKLEVYSFMRHKKKGRKLGVNPPHRKAMLRNLASNLIEHKRIKTTDSRAKELRSFIEPLITKAKRGDLNSIRQISKKIPRKSVVHKLVHEIAPTFSERNGGYTRIIKLGFRDNDRASVSLIEFVDFEIVDDIAKEKVESE